MPARPRRIAGRAQVTERAVERAASRALRRWQPTAGRRSDVVMLPPLAGQTAEELQAAEERRHRNTTRYRLRRHAWPWYGGAGLGVVAGVVWSLGYGAPRFATSAWFVPVVTLVAFGSLALAVWLTPLGGRRWRGHLVRAGVVGAVWLTVAAWAGPSATALAVLAALTAGFGLRWWSDIRIGYPTGAPAPGLDVDPDAETVPQLWRRYVAASGCALPDSHLYGHETTRHGDSWFVQLQRGKQTLTTARNALPQLSSALDFEIRDLVLEPGPRPSVARLQIITRSPIAEAVRFTHPDWSGGTFPIGLYADGDGWAPWRVYEPGEVDPDDPDAPTGSVYGGFVCGGPGSGKSRLLDLIALNTLASGAAVIWSIDPQHGASSVALRRAADWSVGLEESVAMLAALEGLVDARGRENGANDWTGFRPTAERPLLLVIIDEAHEVLPEKKPTIVTRWETLDRKGRKVGVRLVLASQHPSLRSFGGSDPLRASVCSGNLVMMRTVSRTAGGLIPGVTVDPGELPAVPGFAYSSALGDARDAPFRASYPGDRPHKWFAQVPCVELDEIAVGGAGPSYWNRATSSEDRRVHDLARLAAIRERRAIHLGRSVLDDQDPADESAGELEVPQLPTWPAGLHIVRPDDHNDAIAPAEVYEPDVDEPTQGTTRRAILNTLASGETRRKAELVTAAGRSEKAVRDALDRVVADGLVVRVAHGTYRLADPEGCS